jgi:hypothetical protein
VCILDMTVCLNPIPSLRIQTSKGTFLWAGKVYFVFLCSKSSAGGHPLPQL